MRLAVVHGASGTAEPDLIAADQRGVAQAAGPGLIRSPNSPNLTCGLNENSVTGEREADAQNGAGQHIAQKVHAEQNSRSSDDARAQDERTEQRRIK